MKFKYYLYIVTDIYLDRQIIKRSNKIETLQKFSLKSKHEFNGKTLFIGHSTDIEEFKRASTRKIIYKGANLCAR